MVVSLTLCAWGTPETRWGEYFVFLLIMLAIGIGTFIWLLGMPIPILPVKMPDFLVPLFGKS
jgi:heme A synthase